MSSREDILGRVRARLGRDAANAAAGRAAIETVITARASGPRPVIDLAKSALQARFVEKSLAQSSSVDTVATLAEAPAAVARYLASNGLPARAVAWPGLAGLDWTGAGLAVEGRGAVDADLVGLTGCFCAVAETGTLMLCGGPDSPAAVSLLPETHIAIVPAGRIVAGMEDAFALARVELGQLPRAVNFVSGPSRTGDIEQTIVLGAHGPYRVHLVLVEGSE
jgi:L-lactate dehydrogenase complex protein LldG